MYIDYQWFATIIYRRGRSLALWCMYIIMAGIVHNSYKTLIGYMRCMFESFSYFKMCIWVLYSPENEPPPLFDLKFLHRYFYLVYKPLPLAYKNCTVSKNECVVINKNTSLNGLFSSLISSFCFILWLKHGNKLKSSLDGGDGLANGLASVAESAAWQ